RPAIASPPGAGTLRSESRTAPSATASRTPPAPPTPTRSPARSTSSHGLLAFQRRGRRERTERTRRKDGNGRSLYVSASSPFFLCVLCVEKQCRAVDQRCR